MRISDWSSDVCSSDLLASPRPLTVPYADYDEETAGELEIFRAAATAHALYGQGAITVAIISKAASVSDLLELLVLLKEAGLYRPGPEPGATILQVPPIETFAIRNTSWREGLYKSVQPPGVAFKFKKTN